MRATAWEFRLRMLIMVAIIAVGFLSPWLSTSAGDRRVSLLEWLALELSRSGLVSFTVATPVVIVAASLIAALGAVLRVWGTAYLSPYVMSHMEMKGDAVMMSGPYRYVRNPLYLGTVFMISAMCFAMPPTGALLVLILIPLFIVRLILGEERFLSERLGAPYESYRQAVPRLIPRLRASLPAGTIRPNWLKAMVAEVNPIGVLFVMAVLSWRYDNLLLVKAILVVFGLSMVMRALVPGKADADSTARA